MVIKNTSLFDGCFHYLLPMHKHVYNLLFKREFAYKKECMSGMVSINVNIHCDKLVALKQKFLPGEFFFAFFFIMSL